MQRITEVTKRDIIDFFKKGMWIEDGFDDQYVFYPYNGRLSEIAFLKTLYDLKSLKSTDPRFSDAEGDIAQHTNNHDYPDGWVFEDERFELLNGSDETFLQFLCKIFHPAVRDERNCWKLYLDKINDLIRKDGYELYVVNKISERDEYGWRTYSIENDLFYPFSMRHKKERESKELTLSLKKTLRKQIYQILREYTEICHESTDDGFHYTKTTDQCMFDCLRQFYTPGCYVENGQYVETSELEPFIMNTSPFYVFDAIECYAMYNPHTDYADKINSLFKWNSIPYKIVDVYLESTFDIEITADAIDHVQETGVKELLQEAVRYYGDNKKELAVEKLWDAFERLKTYYPELKKDKSTEKIIQNMSGDNQMFYKMYEEEFRALRDIGNNFRIRHHETNRTDIVDDRQYEYFYKRCLSLVSVAIQYL